MEPCENCEGAFCSDCGANVNDLSRRLAAAEQRATDAEADAERLRGYKNERYDDNLRDANRLVGDMMAQRDEARAIAERWHDRWGQHASQEQHECDAVTMAQWGDG